MFTIRLIGNFIKGQITNSAFALKLFYTTNRRRISGRNSLNSLIEDSLGWERNFVSHTFRLNSVSIVKIPKYNSMVSFISNRATMKDPETNGNIILLLQIDDTTKLTDENDIHWKVRTRYMQKSARVLRVSRGKTKQKRRATNQNALVRPSNWTLSRQIFKIYLKKKS